MVKYLLETDILRCTQLQIENQTLETLNVASRKTGNAAQLEGRWDSAASAILNTEEAAPEVNQEVIFENFPDRYAHSVVYKTWIQRADFISGISAGLDYLEIYLQL